MQNKAALLQRRQSYLSPVVQRKDTSGPSHTEGDIHPVTNQTPQTPISDALTANPNSFENAVLDSMHTSTTQSILQWPHFDVFPSLRAYDISIFHLEQKRDQLTTRSNLIYPYIAMEDIDSILDSFEHSINSWYPTMSQSQLHKIRAMLNSGVPPDDSVDGCITLLTMALGCANQVTAGLATGPFLTQSEERRRILKRKMGDIYFQSALKMIYVAHLDISSTATQCLFFVA